MPAALRLLHLVGIFSLGIMLWSGLLIYWAHDPYEIVVFGTTLFHFFPDWFYNLTGAKRKLATGMGWHFVVQWVFIANGLLYCAYLAYSGHWRQVLPTRWRHFPQAVQVALHDFGLVKQLPPQGLYNAAQRISYAAVPVMGLLASLSGWAIYKPVQLGWLLGLFGNYEVARGVHFVTALLFVGFVLVHVAQVLKAGYRHLGAMFLGTPAPMGGHEEEHSSTNVPQGLITGYTATSDVE
jgi:thiosulfate reductase cytochrome b subunit